MRKHQTNTNRKVFYKIIGATVRFCGKNRKHTQTSTTTSAELLVLPGLPVKRELTGLP